MKQYSVPSRIKSNFNNVKNSVEKREFSNKNRRFFRKLLPHYRGDHLLLHGQLDHVRNDVNTNIMNVDENTTNGIFDIDSTGSNIVEIDGDCNNS